MVDLRDTALEYHSSEPKGKIALKTVKPMNDQCELSLAYTPGVSFPCLEIQKDNSKIWDYTFKGNTVAVVSDGSAVLGLGSIGAEASLPVMEGKAMLFKKFAGIDAFPICIKDVLKDNKTDVDALVDFVRKLSPVFGGINLEDIAAPACFEVEERLIKELDIPVFHDDQHGTAIIVLAGLINAVKLIDKKLEDLKVVINGAGAAGIACARFLRNAGIKNIFLCDSKGLIKKGRGSLNKYKEEFAVECDGSCLGDALVGADVFIGVSVANVLSKDMIGKMNEKPIIFALANPVPEIMPEDAYDAGAFIVATGRSDFPNQVNNVMGFPGIFRAALDVRAERINEKMKIAASEALAEVTEWGIDDELRNKLCELYVDDAELFKSDNPLCPKYIIPKPFDPRVVPRVARKVAEAAVKSGVARIEIENFDEYERTLIEKTKS